MSRRSRKALISACAASAALLFAVPTQAHALTLGTALTPEPTTLSTAPTPAPTTEPTAPLTPTPDYQRVDPPMTLEQFKQGIDTVKTTPWSFDWADGTTSATGTGEVAQAPSTLNGVVQQVETGQVGFNADLPGAGTSLLGVPNAQTLAHSTVMASKTINGRLSQAVCYYEIFTGTPNATRTITFGAAWQCNQAWVRGAVSAALGGLNYANGSVGVHALAATPSLVYTDQGWTPTRTLYQKQTFNREFETQVEDIYGYINLYVDGSAGPNDAFFGQPGVAGAYRSVGFPFSRSKAT